jgi:hypothetical protein
MKITLMICVLVSILNATTSFAATFKGKIIDGETMGPIEGVVVLGTWYTAQFSPAGATHNFYDARETVTDKNGEFSIPGMGVVMSNPESMHILIFKAGYEYLNVPWVSLKRDFLLREKIKWEGSKAIVPLKRLTLEGRNRRGTPSRPSIPIDKMKLMTEEVNKERMQRGLKPLWITRKLNMCGVIGPSW